MRSSILIRQMIPIKALTNPGNCIILKILYTDKFQAFSNRVLTLKFVMYNMSARTDVLMIPNFKPIVLSGNFYEWERSIIFIFECF